jgi:hypothetical protein
VRDVQPADRPLASTEEVRVGVLRLIGKTESGRLAYAAEVVVDGDRIGARSAAWQRLAEHLTAPLGLWPQPTPDTQVWVTETEHVLDLLSHEASEPTTCEYLASLHQLLQGTPSPRRDHHQRHG